TSPAVTDAGDAPAIGVEVPPDEPGSTEARLSDVPVVPGEILSSDRGELDVLATATAAVAALSESQLLVASVASAGGGTLINTLPLLPSGAVALLATPTPSLL
uniref:Uncharacterized protein n=1 Tax=Anopheles maculatus TaxID=74869 RepID=A0A182SA96_9DIPT